MRVKSIEESLRDRIMYIGSCIPAAVAEDRRDKFVLLGFPQLVIDETRGHVGLVDRLVKALLDCEDVVARVQWGSDGDCGVTAKVSLIVSDAFSRIDDRPMTGMERASADADTVRTQESVDD